MSNQPAGTKPRHPKIRRLFWDIETAPNIVLAFSAGFGLNINHDAIIQERKIICIGYKWQGEKKVTVLRWDENQDDKEMLRKFTEVANEADELCHHFGNHFDLPWFRTRVLYHRLPPIPVYKTIDTKQLASKYFLFNSNKLDYISNFLGHGRKLKTDFDLWKKILVDKCEKSLRYMMKYCGVDVRRLESVYLDMEPFIKPHSHLGVMTGGDKWTCPRDGSTNVITHKTKATAHGTMQYQMRCKDCGGYYTISSRAHSEYLEFKRKELDKQLRQPPCISQTSSTSSVSKP